MKDYGIFSLVLLDRETISQGSQTLQKYFLQ